MGLLPSTKSAENPVPSQGLQDAPKNAHNDAQEDAQVSSSVATRPQGEQEEPAVSVDTERVPGGNADARGRIQLFRESGSALFAYATATAAVAYLFIIYGGLVSPTDGLVSCPDWPLCQGRLRTSSSGASVDIGFLLTSAVVTAMTVGLAGWLAVLKQVQPKTARLAPFAMVAAALALGLTFWGAASPGLMLSPASRLLHAGLSLTFFALVLTVATNTTPALSQDQLTAGARRFAFLATGMVILQVVLGGLVRQAGDALGCGPDVPMCAGQGWANTSAERQLVQILHRVGAMATAIVVFASSMLTFRRAGQRRAMRTVALAPPMAVLLEIFVGAQNIKTALALPALWAHLVLGAVLLGAQITAFVWNLTTPKLPRGYTLRRQAGVFWEMTKPRVSVLVIITFIGGAYLAPGVVATWQLGLTLLGTVLIVGAANVFNMYIERDSDRFMRRTATRPLPTGRIDADTALGFGTLLLGLSLPLMLIGSNGMTAFLGLFAFVSYVWMYTPLKSQSFLALFVGAVPGAIPPLMGWTMVTNNLDPGGLALFGILFFWQIPHFLAIALFRQKEYAAAGIQVMPVQLGVKTTWQQSLVFTVALVANTVVLFPLGLASWGFLGYSVLGGGCFFGLLGPGDTFWRRNRKRPWG